MQFKKIKKTKKVGKMVCVSSADKEEVVCSPDGSVKKVEARKPVQEEVRGNNIFIGTLNFLSTPWRVLKENYEKKYLAVKRMFILDLIFLGIIGILTGLNIYLFVSRTVYDFGFLKFQPRHVEIVPPTASVLLTKIKINGQEDLNIDPGENLEYTIYYENNSRENLFDVALKVNLEGAILDFDQLIIDKGVFRNGAIVWTKDQIADFTELKAGAHGELKFKIGTLKIIEPSKILKFGSKLKSQIELSYKLQSGFGESFNFIGDILENKINSDLSPQILVRYFTPEGDQLGRGPLPPKVGETTKYWIFLSVENNLNDVSGVSVTIHLPSNVEWTGNKSVVLGDLSYDPLQRIILWKVGDVLRYSGEEWLKQGVAFEVAFTPTIAQVGKEATLLDRIKIFGTDKFTGQFLERKTSGVTTDLIYDNWAKGKGKVIE